MKRIVRHLFSVIGLAILFLGATSIVGCSDNAETILEKLEISPTTATLAVTTTQQLTVTGIFSDGTSMSVNSTATWTSSDETIATISAAGLVEAKAPGTATISAKLSGREATANITVTAATLEKIEVTPTDSTLAVGTTQQLTAMGVFSDKSTQDITSQVTWTSADATTVEVDSAGLVTAKVVGKAMITATFSTVTGTTDITVTAATLQEIEVTPTNPSVAAGSEHVLKATGIFSDKSTQDITAQVTWSSSDTTVATISNDTTDKGTATTLGTGTTTIRASFSGVDGRTTLTVTSASFKSIIVTPTDPSIAKGTTQQFTATATYSDNTTQDITTQVVWASSDPATATISNATADMGLSSAVAKGTTTIKASLSGVDGTTTLTVTDASIVSIALTPTTPSIAMGTTQQFTAMATYSDNTTQDVTTQVTWSSSDTAIATISNATLDKGQATAVVKGTTTITATISGVDGTTTLTVTDATLSSIAVTPTTPSIAMGTTQQFTAMATYTDSTTQDVTTQTTWSSSDPATATVSNASGSEGLATSVAKGATTVTASLSGIDGTTTLTVSDATVSSIAVTPTTPSIAMGTTLPFIAMATYSDNTTQDVTTQVTWSSSNAATATISNATANKGLATAVAKGSVTIKASLNSVDGTTTLTVTDATISSIAVTPKTPSIAKETTQQFTAMATYTDSTTQDVTTQVAWSSSDPATATISNATGSEGLATAVVKGTTTITASLSSIDATTMLTVTSATLSSIALTPPNPSAPKGTTQQFTAMGTFSDNSTQDITSLAIWTSSTPSVATVSNASGSKGLATALSAGSTTVEAAFMGKKGTTPLAVTPAFLVSIAVTPPLPSTAKGTTQQFTATGTYSDNSNQDITTSVTWASSVAAVASISNALGTEGLASGAKQGTTTISAALSGITGDATLTVTAATLLSIAVTPESPSIAKGTTQQFTATGTYSDNSNQDITAQVTWASSITSIATVSNATGSKGLAIGANEGDTTISATLNAQKGFTTLTVTAATLVSIAVTPPSAVAAKGTTLQFTATGTYSDNSTQDLTKVVVWKSSDSTTAQVSNASGSKGEVTAVVQGSVTITATSEGKIGLATVTVTPASLVSITVTPTNPSIAKGTMQQFTATGIFSDNTNQNITNQVTWASSNTAVATISNAAGSAGRATSDGIGTTTISAKLSGKTGSTELSVTAATLVSIAIAPVNPSIAKGTEQQFVATGTYSDNSTQVITTQATWSSSDELIASISNANSTEGLATAVATGNVTIKAILDGKKGLTLLTVSAATLVSVSVTPVNPSIAKGTKLQFVATGTYSDNSMQVITTQVTWSSSQPSVATISNASGSHGLAAGDGQGQTVIAATIQGMSDSTSLKVTAAKLISIAVTPTDKSLHVNDTQQYTARGTYSDSTVQDITTQVTWTSTDTGVATISSASGSEGLATALVIGHTTIAAAMSGVKGSTGLTVSGT